MGRQSGAAPGLAEEQVLSWVLMGFSAGRDGVLGPGAWSLRWEDKELQPGLSFFKMLYNTRRWRILPFFGGLGGHWQQTCLMDNPDRKRDLASLCVKHWSHRDIRVMCLSQHNKLEKHL